MSENSTDQTAPQLDRSIDSIHKSLNRVLERQNFGKHAGFTFLPVTESVDVHEEPTALHAVVQAEVQSIRTDLDRQSVANKPKKPILECGLESLQEPR